MTEPNPKLERLLIEATRDELEVVLRGILVAEPHLVYVVIGALEKPRHGGVPPDGMKNPRLVSPEPGEPDG